MAATIVAGLALAIATPAGAATAAAGSVHNGLPTQVGIQQTWLSDPNLTSNKQTAVTRTSARGTAQIRFGTYQGVQYGWARILGATGDYGIRFEIDLNGDRVWDLASTQYPISPRSYTQGYATSSSASRAFRACITIVGLEDDCNTGGAAPTTTAWW